MMPLMCLTSANATNSFSVGQLFSLCLSTIVHRGLSLGYHIHLLVLVVIDSADCTDRYEILLPKTEGRGLSCKTNFAHFFCQRII